MFMEERNSHSGVEKKLNNEFATHYDTRVIVPL